MTIDAMNDRSAIAAALADASEDYAAAIDRDELERWPDFFEAECTYKAIRHVKIFRNNSGFMWQLRYHVAIRKVEKILNPKTSIASTVTAQLRARILSGNFAPNTRLRLEELGASFGVSLSPVREALLRLCGEGFVVSEDQRGFRVAGASVRNFEEVVALRSLLEPYALRLSIERGDMPWEESLVAIFHRLTRIAEPARTSFRSPRPASCARSAPAAASA